MKKLLMASMILLAFNAQANGRENNFNNGGSSSSATAGAIGLGVGVGIGHGGAGGNGGDSSANNGGVKFEDRLQIPNAPSLSSGNSNSSGANRIYQQRQVSTFFGGYTNIDMVLDLPAFVKSNPSTREELAACIQDKGFRTLRRLENNACPD